MNLRKRTWEIVSVAKRGDRLSLVVDVFLLTLILLNVVAVILESVRRLDERFHAWFWGFEVFSVIVFSIEYVARVYSCVESPAFSRPIAGRLRFMTRPMSIIDMLAVLPFYLPFVGVDLRFARVFRLMRVFRVAKISRYSKSVRLLARVAVAKANEMVIAVILMTILIVAASCLMYFVEHVAQPEKFSSIPVAMWWSVATLTTVGYGDVYPITPLGKLLGAFVAVIGIGFFALPTAILGAGFVEALQQSGRASTKTCPHCGKTVE